MNKKIKITQKELHNIIKESVNILLNEMDWRSYEEFAKKAEEESRRTDNPFIQAKRKDQAENFSNMAGERMYSQYNLKPNDSDILKRDPQKGGYNPKYEKERRRIMRNSAQRYDDIKNYFGGKSMYDEKAKRWITPSDEERKQMKEKEEGLKKIEQDQLRKRENDENARMKSAEIAREKERRKQEDNDNKRKNSLTNRFKNLFNENVNEISFDTIRNTNKKMRQQYGQTERAINLVNNYKERYTRKIKGWTITPDPKKNIITVNYFDSYVEPYMYRFDIERDEWIDGKLPKFDNRAIANTLVDVISSINPDSYFANKNFYIR